MRARKALSRGRWAIAVAVGLGGALFARWSLGPYGDAGFAAQTDGVLAACFVIGAGVARWWFPPLLAVGWLFAWFFGGSAVDPSGYTWAISFLAPLVGVFAALGVAWTRGRRRTLAPTDEVSAP